MEFLLDFFQVLRDVSYVRSIGGETIPLLHRGHLWDVWFRLPFVARFWRGRLDWTMIEFKDNQPVIDLVSKKPRGLLMQLEEQGLLGRRANNKALLQASGGGRTPLCLFSCSSFRKSFRLFWFSERVISALAFTCYIPVSTYILRMYFCCFVSVL